MYYEGGSRGCSLPFDVRAHAMRNCSRPTERPARAHKVKSAQVAQEFRREIELSLIEIYDFLPASFYMCGVLRVCVCLRACQWPGRLTVIAPRAIQALLIPLQQRTQRNHSTKRGPPSPEKAPRPTQMTLTATRLSFRSSRIASASRMNTSG